MFRRAFVAALSLELVSRGLVARCLHLLAKGTDQDAEPVSRFALWLLNALNPDSLGRPEAVHGVTAGMVVKLVDYLWLECRGAQVGG
jgi:hypothetical protein